MQNINGMRVDIWLPIAEEAPTDAVDELFHLLAGPEFIAEIPAGFAGDWWMCQGILPDMKLIRWGLKTWTEQHGGIFRVLEPGSPAFPPEVAVTLNDLED